MVQLKSEGSKNGSESIVVSFDSRWLKPLHENRISVVFRKRGPRSFSPKYIYVYVGSPVSALVGRTKVTKYEWMPLESALCKAQDGFIKEEELRNYAGRYSELAVFSVERFQAMPNTLSLQYLHDTFEFYPPQSFLRLSIQGEAELEKRGNFSSHD